jgi:hypothetical protein
LALNVPALEYPTRVVISFTLKDVDKSSRFASWIRTAVRNWPGATPVACWNIRVK